MKLAVNFSDALLSLLEREPELPVDYIKFPTIPFPGCWEQFERGKNFRKILPHLSQPGVIALAHPEPGQRFDAGTVLKVLERTKPPYLSTHLETRVEFFPEFQAHQHQSDPLLVKTVKAHLLKAIEEVKTAIPVPLVLENFPFYRWWKHYRLGSESWFIREICEAGDCGFLLDIAHARCSAWNMECKVNDYLNELPLVRTREIHLAGVQLREEGLRDAHTALGEEDYTLFESVLDRTDPEIVSIEYGGLPDRIMNLRAEYEPISRNDPEELREMIKRVVEICR